MTKNTVMRPKQPPQEKEETAYITQQCGSLDDEADKDTVRLIIETVTADIREIEAFYHCNFSLARTTRLQAYFEEKLKELNAFSFEKLNLEAQTDYILLRKYLHQQLKELQSFESEIKKCGPVLEPFATSIIELLERRQKVVPTDGQYAAGVLAAVTEDLEAKHRSILDHSLRLEGKEGKFTAYRAANSIEALQPLLQEWHNFYKGYNPLMTWWVAAPYETLLSKLKSYAKVVREELVGVAEDDEDAIVGQPVGRQGLLDSLDNAFIAYTPEELIQLGEKEYTWCETEMLKAAHDLGYGDDWKAALEHVKNMYVPPGSQTLMVHELSREAIQYVKAHDMVTVPRVAEECLRTYMILPEQQKVSPFFLGGPYFQVSYPTDTMSHSAKLMAMRGNNRPMSRSTVFHENVPGHHLQYHMIARYRPYRNLFSTSFWMEGWAFYWEFILRDRGFARTPEEKIGMLFWRMHRCARIVFSLKFHMGDMTPQECIDFLVDKVGHERATAEGEVRRSFNGEYGVLYQAGYMLGALQFYALRKEVVENGGWTEKEFHDRVLREGQMPVEILRALLKGERLGLGHEAAWRFYEL